MLRWFRRLDQTGSRKKLRSDAPVSGGRYEQDERGDDQADAGHDRSYAARLASRPEGAATAGDIRKEIAGKIAILNEELSAQFLRA